MLPDVCCERSSSRFLILLLCQSEAFPWVSRPRQHRLLVLEVEEGSRQSMVVGCPRVVLYRVILLPVRPGVLGTRPVKLRFLVLPLQVPVKCSMVSV